MRPLQSILESYTENNSALLRYLRNGEFDPYRAWWEVCQWIVQNDMQEAIGFPPETSRDVIHEEEPDLFYKLPEDDQRQCAEWCLEYLMHNDPAEAPTHAHLSVSDNRLIPASSWLVHFSDNAREIALNGFTYGIDEMDRLGLTTWFGDGAKKHGGYNFAYLAMSRYAQWAASRGKYGRHAVMFQNSGVHTHHYGDEEDQIIFWGKDVSPKKIVLLLNDGGDWCVISSSAKRDVLFRNENYGKVADWVIRNHQQYRRALFGINYISR